MNSRRTKPYDFDFLAKLGQRIRHVRKLHRDLTQEQLATAAHTTTAQICRIEYGVFYGLNALTLKAIADALDTTVADLTNPQSDEFIGDVELQRLFSRISNLDERKRNQIIAMMRALLESETLELQRVARRKRIMPFVKSRLANASNQKQ